MIAIGKKPFGDWGATRNRRDATDIHLSRNIKCKYSEIVPVLSGQGEKVSITLMGRRRDNPKQLEVIISRAWGEGEPVKIVWEDLSTVPSA